jgi:gamma-glutamyl:cysteine ligase YbdK (ATP-grasp superfamily)
VPWLPAVGGKFMSDQVPEKYRGIFTNEEWVQHQFIVWGSWIYLGVAVVVHLFILASRPWIK